MEQLCFPHFNSLPQGLVQMCSGSNPSSVCKPGVEESGRIFFLAANLSCALTSPEQHFSPHSCLPQFKPALQLRMQ
jgi:hypothetical protein